MHQHSIWVAAPACLPACLRSMVSRPCTTAWRVLPMEQPMGLAAGSCARSVYLAPGAPMHLQQGVQGTAAHASEGRACQQAGERCAPTLHASRCVCYNHPAW